MDLQCNPTVKRFLYKRFPSRMLACLLATAFKHSVPGLKLPSCELHFVWSLSAKLFGMDIPNRRDKISGQYSFTGHQDTQTFSPW